MDQFFLCDFLRFPLTAVPPSYRVDGGEMRGARSWRSRYNLFKLLRLISCYLQTNQIISLKQNMEHPQSRLYFIGQCLGLFWYFARPTRQYSKQGPEKLYRCDTFNPIESVGSGIPILSGGGGFRSPVKRINMSSSVGHFGHSY